VAAMHDQGIDEASVALEHMVDMRYTAQINSVRVALDVGRFDSSSAAGIIADFDAEYARLFGRDSGFAEAGYVMTSVSVRGRAARRSAVAVRAGVRSVGGAEDGSVPVKGERSVVFYDTSPDPVTTPLYDGPAIQSGMTIEGPAILEFVDTTVVVRHGQSASVDASGSIVIDVRSSH
jgi:N-methylhydantoinase A